MVAEYLGFPVVKNLLVNAGDAGDAGLIPGSGRFPGGRNGNPLQYSCQENSMDRGAWQATVHGVTESDTTEHTHTHTHTHTPEYLESIIIIHIALSIH